MATIQYRHRLLERVKQSYIEWQTKEFGSFVAELAPTKEAGEAIVKKVNSASLTGLLTASEGPQERSDRPGPRPVPQAEGFDPADHEAAIQRALAKNQSGSFEKLMKGMGG